VHCIIMTISRLWLGGLPEQGSLSPCHSVHHAGPPLNGGKPTISIVDDVTVVSASDLKCRTNSRWSCLATVLHHDLACRLPIAVISDGDGYLVPDVRPMLTIVEHRVRKHEAVGDGNDTPCLLVGL